MVMRMLERKVNHKMNSRKGPGGAGKCLSDDMSYSYELQAKIPDGMTELEQGKKAILLITG
jgi:hypothetical protein